MIGSRIAEERKKSGMTQTALAIKCQITQPMIAKYENGYPISRAQLANIAKALGISSEELKKQNEARDDNSNEFNEYAFNQLIKEIRFYPDEDKAAIFAILNGYKKIYKYKELYLKAAKLF